MGVHGLSGLVKALCHDKDNATSTTLLPGSTTLAIDGNGLIFHLFRLAYRRHRQDVLSRNHHEHCKALQSQLLLPVFTPLSLVDDVTTTYLSQLTVQHGMHLQIYFDGPDQYMKSHEKQRRRESRDDEWENTRQLCLHGILPGKGPSKFRSSARRQAREHERQSLSGDNGEEVVDENASQEELYLNSFPLSPLVMAQIERSIHAFADIYSAALPSGSVQIIFCDGEADVVVARASAKDAFGLTYALGNDTDYLIYGAKSDDSGYGDSKYIPFRQLNPSADSLYVGTVLTRPDVASGLGMPSPESMIELSVLLGNDYTRPFVRCDDSKKRKEFWGSLRWIEHEHATEGSGDGERLPPENELQWYDTQGVADHVAEKVADGMRLTSDMEELKLAIEFSYELYSFCDVSGFPMVAPGSTSEEEETGDAIDKDASLFPSLPRGFDISLAERFSADTDLCEAAIIPVATYMSANAAESNGISYMEQRHLDAFRMTLDSKKTQNEHEIEPPQQKMQWADMQALYVLEKCLLEAIGMNDTDALGEMPCRVFDHSTFHSCLEAVSFQDFPLDNDLHAKNEKASLDGATSRVPAPQEKEPIKSLVLPIDEHKDAILNTIKTQRVTIIHGETGCGKSSRVPCFLLRADPPEPTRKAPEVKMIVSQPRRIAAKALAERVRSCEPDISDKIGLRMGHGIREYETSNTRAWFVTTGYVVRLLANHPSWFDSHTHLIIDEVHERSIDTDILCLLCRRLLQSHPTIRLVLMSATMAAELYSQYFGTPEPPIHVGVRTFPIKEFFVEDLKSLLSLSTKHAKLAQDVHNHCEKTRCTSAPPATNMDKLYRLATQITASVGGNGSSVLIFVPGMSDIEAIIELIENIHVNNTVFICLPIHSDVPFEEQMAAFAPAKKGEVKVIIATNAAESSLTLPDVDHVICLGLCKQIVYNRASHRQMLVPTWISKASATQRAGRTGRVRSGNVYRLYSRNTFKLYMQPFDQGELVRTPLDSTILNLRGMLNEAVTPILLDCLEPPDISNIDRSFQSLHASNFISDPTDEGEITSLGSLVVALGIDLTLGAFVGLGIQFGVAAEAIQLAAILSFPKTPWAISSPMYHDTQTFNDIVSKTFVSRCSFDAGLFSEPMAISNLLHDFSHCKDRNQFCWKHSVSGVRMRHLAGTVESLKRRVAQCLDVRAEVLEMKTPPKSMGYAKINILRILQIWLFHDTMIQHSKSSKRRGDTVNIVNGTISIPLEGPPISRDHLAQVLDENRHPFELVNRGKVVKTGSFDPAHLELEAGAAYLQSLDIRFISYVLEKGIDLSLLCVGNSLKLFVQDPEIRDSIISKITVTISEVSYVKNTGVGNQRGRRGRACGAWHPLSKDSMSGRNSTLPLKHMFVLTSQLTKSQAKKFTKYVDQEMANKMALNSIISCKITPSNKSSTRIQFSMSSSGECVSTTDLIDLFAAPDLTTSSEKSNMKQCVLLKRNESEGATSNIHPLLEDSPEGARLLSVLASERRRENFVRFSKESSGPNSDDMEFIDVNLPKSFAINGNRWKRKDSGGMVFVPENCVPVAAMPTNNSLELFCCCANTLDLRGGACRVEGITMLPPGRLFIGLALLSFGINPRTGLPIENVAFDMYAGEEKKEESELIAIEDTLSWIYEKGNVPYFMMEEERVVNALSFHKSCMKLGETLECQPDRIFDLCEIFNGVNGQPMATWDGYDLSLKAAATSLMPISINKKINRRVSNHEDSQSEAASQNKEACPPKPKDAKPTISNSPKESFACLVCNKVFTKYKKLKKHCEKCCPGTKFNRKKSIALAKKLEANVTIKTKTNRKAKTKDVQANANSILAPTSEYAKAKPKANETLQSKISPQLVWVCPSSKVHFAKKRHCEKHMKKCSIGLAKDSEPLLMYVYEGCNKMFDSPKKCRSHIKGCYTGQEDGKGGYSKTEELTKSC